MYRHQRKKKNFSLIDQSAHYWIEKDSPAKSPTEAPTPEEPKKDIELKGEEEDTLPAEKEELYANTSFIGRLACFHASSCHV